MKAGLSSEVFKDKKPTNKIEDSEFPLDVFPEVVQDIIIDLNKSQGLPVDFVAGAMLFAISTAIGNTHISYLKRDTTATATIYMALVGKAGSGKSYPLDWVLKPIRNRDRAYYKTYLNSYKDFKDGLITEQPILKRFLVNDITKEKLNLVHSQNPRGLGMVNDELMNFYYNINRYHKGNDLQFWLSSWSNKRTIADRIKDELPQHDYEQFVSIAGTVQPELLNEFLKGNNQFNGFFERWLFASPKVQKFATLSEQELQQSTIDNWANIIEKIMDISFEIDSIPKVLKFNDQAFKYFMNWYKTNAEIVNTKNDDALFKLQGKFSIYAQRLSLILEVLNWATNNGSGMEMTKDAVEKGIKLTEYYREISLDIYRKFVNNSVAEKKLKEQFIERLPDEKFKTQDAEKIADDIGVKRKSVFNYLKDYRVERLEHGVYQKKQLNGTTA